MKVLLTNLSQEDFNYKMKINKKIFLYFCFLSCTSAPPYKGPKSDHFDGKKFYNKYNHTTKNFFSFLKWRLNSKKGDWPKWIKNKLSSKPKTREEEKSLTATFINHATVLIQIGNVNILTDPIFSRRTSPVSWAGPQRIRKPGVTFENLPPIDIILISHNHYDHLDIPTLKMLAKRDNPIILSGLGNGLLFKQNGLLNYKDMDWNDKTIIKGVSLTFLTAQHWSARGLTDRFQTLWGSFLIERDGKKVYFAGDTGYGPHFSEIGDQYGPIDLSLLPIGAYKPRWFMKYNHMSPMDAVQAHIDLKSGQSLAIHFGTFSLGDDSFVDPINDLNLAIKEKTIPSTSFYAPDFGEIKKIY